MIQAHCVSRVISPVLNISKSNRRKQQAYKIIQEQKGRRKPLKFPDSVSKISERVNGRLAMIGFVAGTLKEINTGECIYIQLTEHIGYTLAITSVVVLSSFIKKSNSTYYNGGLFNPQSELINGRYAMIGILSLLVTETMNNNTPLFF
jgi:hypothetical protein